eukprot:gene2156-2297_t
MTSQNQSNVLFIGDLSIFCTEKDLNDLFSGFGTVTEVKIMKSDDKGRSLSYGFVKFSDPADAARAMNHLQHKLLHGRHLRINYASHRSKGNNPLSSHSDGLETSPVHVSFISYQIHNLVTETSLRVLFSKYGEVADVSIKKSTVDRALNRQSGYGFVHYPITPEGINAAFRAATELQDTTVDEVNYKSSLSHKLAGYIEQSKVLHTQASQVTSQNKDESPKTYIFNSSELKPNSSAPLLPHQLVPGIRQFNYVPMPVSNTPAPAPPLPSPSMQHQQLSAYPQMNSFAPTLPVQPPQLRSSMDQTIVVSPVMVPHYLTSPPQMDYSRFPYDSNVHFPANLTVNGFTLFHNPVVNSPPQTNHSPQTFYTLGDNRYGCTPSSISSVETMFDQLVAPLLVSPSDYAFNKVSSPLAANHSHPLSAKPLSSIPKNTNNVNLKKLRQRPVRKALNQLEIGSQPYPDPKDYKSSLHDHNQNLRERVDEKSEIDSSS